MSFSDGSGGDTLYFKWTSRSGTPPVPTTLAGSPVVSIYKDASTTESTAGVTLTVDFDSRTGLNHVSIDTSADGTFYANGHKFYLVITTGTVGGTSVVGEVVGEFMLGVAALTAAQIATGVWQDTTSGDFTASSSIGKSLYTSGVVPGASGGLFIAGTNAATTITTSLTTHLVGTVDTVTTVTNQLTAAQIATGIWQDATGSDFTTTSSIGKSLYTSGAVPGAAGGLFIAGTNAATTITTALTTTFTGNLTGSVGSVTGAVGSVTGNVGGYSGVDWARLTNTATTVDLSGTTIKDLDGGNSILSAVSNIAVTSAALNTTAASATYTTGTSTGGAANTYTLDGVFDSVAAAGNAIDVYYEFDLSATTGATAVGVTWDGYLAGAVNTIKVYAYNWGATGWDQVGNVTGIAGTVVGAQEFELTSAHTGTGGNLGKARIRFAATGLTTGTLKTDRILMGYAVVIVPPANFSSLSIDGSGIVQSRLAEVAHGGAAATLRLGSSGTPAFFVTNSAGNAVRFEATALDGGGLALIGGPDGGNGLYCLGGSNSGDAAILRGQGGNSAGLILQGSGSSAGLDSLGGSGAPGGHFTGGSGSPGLVCEAAGGDADGVKFLGSGSGTGLFCQGGSDGGNGVHFVAGGADLAGVGQGAGAYAEGGGSSGCGIICLAYDGTSEAALSLRGSASGEGPGLSITANSGNTSALIMTGAGTGFGFDGTLSPATLASFFLVDTTKVYADAISGSVVKEIAANAGGGADPNVILSGVLGDQGLGDVDHVVLPSGPIDNGVLVGSRLRITSGIAQYQERTITGWDGTNKIARIDQNFLPGSPTDGDAFQILYDNSYQMDGSGSVISVAYVVGLSADALAELVTLDTTKTAADIAAGSVVYLSRHSIAGLGF